MADIIGQRPVMNRLPKGIPYADYHKNQLVGPQHPIVQKHSQVLSWDLVQAHARQQLPDRQGRSWQPVFSGRVSERVNTWVLDRSLHLAWNGPTKQVRGAQERVAELHSLAPKEARPRNSQVKRGRGSNRLLVRVRP